MSPVSDAVSTVLIVEDEPGLRQGLCDVVSAMGLSAVAAAGIAEGRRSLDERPIDCVLLDIRLRDGDGLDFLRELRAGPAHDVPVIVATAYGDSERTIRAMRDGAFDYLTKPFDLPLLRTTVLRATKQRALSRAAGTAPAGATGGAAAERPASDLVGTSAAMLGVWKLIGRAAASTAPVLITGETGTGKELVGARDPHLLGARRRALHRHQPGGAAAHADRERAVRPRARRLHRRDVAARRPLRERRRGNVVPRRDRRPGPDAADQAAARRAGGDVRARRRRRGAAHARAHHRRHQPPRAPRQHRRDLARGAVLPPRGHRDRRAAAARASQRHPAAGEPRAARDAGARGLGGSDGGPAGVRLARQRARAVPRPAAGGGAVRAARSSTRWRWPGPPARTRRRCPSSQTTTCRCTPRSHASKGAHRARARARQGQPLGGRAAARIGRPLLYAKLEEHGIARSDTSEPNE